MATGKRDYYETLGVDKSASKEDIKKAFRKLAMQYHPDRQAGKSDEEKKEAEDKFKELNEAAEVLTDDKKREAYDNFGHAGIDGMGGGDGHEVDPREFFRSMHGFDDDSDMFGFGSFGPYGFSRRRNDRPVDGSDVKIEMAISIADSVCGAVKTISMGSRRKCAKCNGTGDVSGNPTPCPFCGGAGVETTRNGMMIIQQTCRHCGGRGHSINSPCDCCHGSGIEDVVHEVKVNVEKGAVTGDHVIIPNEGGKGKNGGRDGDMYVFIKVKDDDIFEVAERSNQKDLVVYLYIDAITASIGGKVSCPTPYGECEVTVPPGIEAGKLMRLRGKGLGPNGNRGDLYAQAIVEPLVNLNDQQKRLLEMLSKMNCKSNTKKSETQSQIFREYMDKLKASGYKA